MSAWLVIAGAVLAGLSGVPGLLLPRAGRWPLGALPWRSARLTVFGCTPSWAAMSAW